MININNKLEGTKFYWQLCTQHNNLLRIERSSNFTWPIPNKIYWKLDNELSNELHGRLDIQLENLLKHD
jgi:hypothetical protein